MIALRSLPSRQDVSRIGNEPVNFPLADLAEVAQQFKPAKADRVGEILETLAALGQAREVGDGRYVAG